MANLEPVIHLPRQGRTDHVLGTPIDHMLTGDQTGGTLYVMENGAEPGQGVPTHTHTMEDETFIVMEGEVEFVVAGVSTLAGPGTLVFGPRGIPHSWFAKTRLRMLVLVTPSGLEKMFGELGSLPDGDIGAVVAVCARYGITFA